MRPNRLYHIQKYSNTELFVNATIGFSENLFLVFKRLQVVKLTPTLVLYLLF